MRTSRGKKVISAINFAETVADTKATAAKAQTEAFAARLVAITTILTDAQPYDVMILCASALAGAIPLCCDEHQDEFKADFLRVLKDFVAVQANREAGEDGAAPPRLH